MTFKDFIPTDEVVVNLSRCEVAGVSRSRADAQTDNIDTSSSEGNGATVNPMEAPGPMDDILRIKVTRLRALVGRLKPKNSNRD